MLVRSWMDFNCLVHSGSLSFYRRLVYDHPSIKALEPWRLEHYFNKELPNSKLVGSLYQWYCHVADVATSVGVLHVAIVVFSAWSLTLSLFWTSCFASIVVLFPNKWRRSENYFAFISTDVHVLFSILSTKCFLAFPPR